MKSASNITPFSVYFLWLSKLYEDWEKFTKKVMWVWWILFDHKKSIGEYTAVSLERRLK